MDPWILPVFPQEIIAVASFQGICCNMGCNWQFCDCNLLLGELLMFCMTY